MKNGLTHAEFLQRYGDKEDWPPPPAYTWAIIGKGFEYLCEDGSRALFSFQTHRFYAKTRRTETFFWKD